MELAEQTRWCQIMREACHDETVLTLREIYIRLGVGERKLNAEVAAAQAAGDTDLIDALDYARTIIGVRREKLGLHGKIAGDMQIIRSTMPIYDKEYQDFILELKRYREQMKGEPIEVRIVRYGEDGQKVPINDKT